MYLCHYQRIEGNRLGRNLNLASRFHFTHRFLYISNNFITNGNACQNCLDISTYWLILSFFCFRFKSFGHQMIHITAWNRQNQLNFLYFKCFAQTFFLLYHLLDFVLTKISILRRMFMAGAKVPVIRRCSSCVFLIINLVTSYCFLEWDFIHNSTVFYS